MSGRTTTKRRILDARERLAVDAWERFASGEEVRGGIRPDILLSWHRSRDDYKVDPSRACAPVAAAEEEQSVDAIVVAAELGAAAVRIAADIEPLGGIVSIADGAGRVLSAWGERRTIARAREQNLGPWYGWNEAATGTTGIGLALESPGPVGVTRAEHWCSAFQAWSCNAVAVREPVSKTPVGVIAVSAERQELPETTIAPLLRAVRQLELGLRERGTRPAVARPTAGSATSRIAATHAGRLVIVHAYEVRLAEFADGIVVLDTDRGRFRAMARNLLELEARVDSGSFVRISRQTLVNRERVREVTSSQRRGVWVGLDGTDVLLPVSRRRVPALRRALNVR